MPEHKKLVIVESPAKAKTIAQYLGDGYDVQASVGHIRDLIEPKNLPPELKKGSLGKFSIDVENGFAPYYVVSDEKKRTVADLKRALKDADELYLATDEDREGEAIAWHLLEVLKPTVPVKRMVFHEITKDAIEAARNNPRELDTALVDAQETRRILDRLYGFEVSPVLWRKVGPGLSAGRVQSAATRLVVDRERERQAFVAASYWDLIAELLPNTSADRTSFESRLARLDGKRVASGRDYDDLGQLKGDVVALDETAAESARRRAAPAEHRIHGLESRDQAVHATSRGAVHDIHPAAGGGAQAALLGPPDDERGAGAVRERLHHLYAHRLADALAAGDHGGAQPGDQAVRRRLDPREAARLHRQVEERAGGARGDPPVGRGVPHAVRAVEHAARQRVQALRPDLEAHRRLADGRRSRVHGIRHDHGATTGTAGTAEFTASGTVITFRGFLSAYEEGHDEERNEQDAGASDEQRSLPPLTVGQVLDLGSLEAKGHETSPPPRYTEASLVKALEELGIGRPSTYASIISTIIDRGYVTPRGTALVPSWIAFSVVRLLEEHFADLVEYDFTAEMEEDLDRIADGEAEPGRLADRVLLRQRASTAVCARSSTTSATSTRATSTRSASRDDITLRIGKYGPYLEIPPPAGSAIDTPPRRVNVPDDLAPDELTEARARELIDAPVVGDRELGVNPANGKTVVAKDGRYGPYVTELEPEPGRAGARAEADRARRGARARRRAREHGRAQGRTRRPARSSTSPRRCSRRSQGQAQEEEGRRRQAAHGIPLQGHGPGHRRSRDGPAAARPAAGRRQGPGVRRRHHGAERPLRAVHQEGHRLPVARGRGADLLDRPRRRPRGVRAAEVRRARVRRAR